MRSLLVPLLALAPLVACAGFPNAAERAAGRDALRRLQEQSRAGCWVVRGVFRDGTGEGSFVEHYSADGRFARRTEGGLPRGSGFDGARVWAQGLDGIAREVHLGERERVLVEGWVLAGAWDRLQATGAPHGLALSMPGGREEARLRLDPENGLPRALELADPSGTRTLELGKWRAVLDRPQAHEVVASGSSGPAAVWRVTEVRALAAMDPSLFAPPAAPDDTRFDGTLSGELEARLTGGRLFLRPRLDGREVGWMLLDSGAGASALDATLADALHWPRLCSATLVGAAGRGARDLRRGGEVTLGPLTVSGLPWIEVDGARLSEAIGAPVVGLLGADLLARCVIELDLRAGRARLFDPARWTAPPGATPVRFDGNVPCVEGSFAPSHRGWFRLDTGSDDTVTFHGPTVQRLGLARGREDLRTVRVRGLEGDALGDLAPLEWLELLGQRFARIPVTLLRYSRGGLAREDLAGNVGAGLLRGRRVVFALPHGRVVLGGAAH